MELNKILFIIVLYKNSLEESKTIATLNNYLSVSVDVLVFDNSPKKQYNESSFIYGKFKVEYHHDSSNPGLNFAYNYALNQANENNYQWLLLLDQDTIFTKEYIDTIYNLDFKNLSVDTVSLIPKVKNFTDNKLISPSKMYLGGICKPTEIKSDVINTPVSGINSGTILRTSYIVEIGGFSNDYSLDMLDHWYFRRIFKDYKNIFLMNCTIFQDLSIFGIFEENVSLSRYKQMLLAEIHFVKNDGIFSIIVFKIRLLCRVFKQYKYNNKRYYKLSLKHLF